MQALTKASRFKRRVKRVVEDLKAQNLLEKEEPHVHSVESLFSLWSSCRTFLV